MASSRNMTAKSNRKFFFNFRDFDHKSPTSSTSTLITSWKLTINKLSFNFLHQIFYFLFHELFFFCLFIFFSFSLCIIYFHSRMFNEKIFFCFNHTQRAFFRDQNENFLSTLWLDELKNQTKLAYTFFFCFELRENAKKEKTTRMFIVRTRCFFSMSAHGVTFRVLIVANVVLHFHVLMKFFFCCLSHFLCRKILVCIFSHRHLCSKHDRLFSLIYDFMWAFRDFSTSARYSTLV